MLKVILLCFILSLCNLFFSSVVADAKLSRDNEFFSNIIGLDIDIDFLQQDIEKYKVVKSIVEYIEKNTYIQETNGESKAVLEYKKINPTKYRLVVHNIAGNLPLYFSETYHLGWKLYLVPWRVNVDRDKGDLLKKYKPFIERQADQASFEEVSAFLNAGYVSDLGNGHKKHKNKVVLLQDGRKEKLSTEEYAIDYISKNFNGVILNENLSQGSISETWLPGKVSLLEKNNKLSADISELTLETNYFSNALLLPENFHWRISGFANGWWVGVDQLKKELDAQDLSNKYYKNNHDGTISLEFVLEFWPQRLFYLGLFVSFIVVILSTVYLIFYYNNKRRQMV